MKGLYVIYKISDFAVVETLNTLVNMNSPDRVLKSSKKCTNNVKCSRLECSRYKITTITKRKASGH